MPTGISAGVGNYPYNLLIIELQLGWSVNSFRRLVSGWVGGLVSLMQNIMTFYSVNHARKIVPQTFGTVESTHTEY